ncbi:MAG: hypothetical protein ACLS4Z_04760 [Christensenellaceae bacterium]
MTENHIARFIETDIEKRVYWETPRRNGRSGRPVEYETLDEERKKP